MLPNRTIDTDELNGSDGRFGFMHTFKFFVNGVSTSGYNQEIRSTQ
jgi:hypothetical protein